MANQWFRFKQFMIRQDRCAMKVGTDGVILGAWANTANSKKALDIGAGTGLLSLMLAQRSPGLRIDAIEIDPGAASQAKENVRESIFHSQVQVIQEDFRNFILLNKERYDLVISNPPFYADSYRPSNRERSLARHSDTLNIEELINGAALLLSRSGRLCMILPVEMRDRVLELTVRKNLFLARELEIFPAEGKESNRYCMEFSFLAPDLIREILVIEEGKRHSYSKEYIQLTKDFYLDF